MRKILSTVAMVLVLAACGGSSDDGDAATTTAGADAPADDAAVDETDAPDDGGDDAGSSPADAFDGLPMVAFDASGLPTTPIGGDGASGGEVVDACAALPAAEVSAIVQAFEAEVGLGATGDFVAESEGSTCRYSADTHLVKLVIGPADVVSADPGGSALDLPVLAGEVTATPWATDGSVSIFSEDSFDIGTAFAAHAPVGDLGVIVNNVGGTGLGIGSDQFQDGELWARLASAAAEAAPGAPTTAAVDSGSDDLDPCTLFTIAEIDAFLPDATMVSDSDITSSDGCVWTNEDRFFAVRIRVQPDTDFSDGVPAVPGGQALSNDFGRVWVPFGDQVISVVVEDDRDPDTELFGFDAEVALAENIATRLG